MTTCFYHHFYIWIFANPSNTIRPSFLHLVWFCCAANRHPLVLRFESNGTAARRSRRRRLRGGANTLAAKKQPSREWSAQRPAVSVGSRPALHLSCCLGTTPAAVVCCVTEKAAERVQASAGIESMLSAAEPRRLGTMSGVKWKVVVQRIRKRSAHTSTHKHTAATLKIKRASRNSTQTKTLGKNRTRTHIRDGARNDHWLRAQSKVGRRAQILTLGVFFWLLGLVKAHFVMLL